MLSPEDVQKVATLARLKLSTEELQQVSRQLDGSLDYVAVLNEVDVSNVEPMAHVADVANAFREDEVRASLPREESLSNAPKTDGKYFLVPQILETA
ncbi:MAG: Asp-tRNA(Asn)/Glu-tRNA(Gln) amidotransferase subunit GatC [Planctomycetota bacterium]|nr:Asp-tRNA(Asn)/Glu-tRNA(Gln) amidotransferase subunit GatC [Planctomycetota bacterium]